MKTGSITYNGKNSLELGVYTTGSGSFDAAELDVDRYEVAGRNGDVIIPKNRYKNIEVTYPAFIPNQFGDKVQSVRNWLRSAKVYARLEDTYDMDHFRLGIPSGVQSFEPVNRNDGANFEMTFDCKPQRFLKSGETPETVEPDVQTASGEIASFETDYVVPFSSAEVSLSPQQDLNGYDSPWPAGGGKNILPDSYYNGDTYTNGNVTFKKNADGSVTVSCSTADSTARNYSLIQQNGASPFKAGTYIATCGNATGQSGGNKLQLIIGSANSTVPFSTVVQNNPKTFTLDSDNATLGYCLIQAVAGFTGTVTVYPMIRLSSVADATWEPYSNICPITGHTGAELYRTGKNLISPVTYQYNASSVYLGATDAGYHYYLKAGQYTISASLNTAARILTREQNDTGNTNIGGTQPSLTPGGTFTISKDGLYRFWLYRSDGIPAEDINWVQLELGSSATAYEPYQGDTYSVTFTDQGTVYGGTFDWVNGKLTVTMASVDLGTLTWTIDPNRPGVFYTGGIVSLIKIPTGTGANLVCSAYAFRNAGVPSATNLESANNTISAYPSYGGGRVFVIDISKKDMTTADFKTAMSGVQLVYELATPLEYTLSAQQIETLLGENNVWSDAGEITVEYAEPYNVENPTQFEARPLFIITNPEQGDVLSVSGVSITFVDSYTGTVTIDCETMDCYAGFSNMNYLITATDFPVLGEGTSIVTWSGSGECKMITRWWEL